MIIMIRIIIWFNKHLIVVIVVVVVSSRGTSSFFLFCFVCVVFHMADFDFNVFRCYYSFIAFLISMPIFFYFYFFLFILSMLNLYTKSHIVQFVYEFVRQSVERSCECCILCVLSTDEQLAAARHRSTIYSSML